MMAFASIKCKRARIELCSAAQQFLLSFHLLFLIISFDSIYFNIMCCAMLCSDVLVPFSCLFVYGCVFTVRPVHLFGNDLSMHLHAAR